MKNIIYNHNTITPSKIICIGRNYVEHIEELNNEIPSSMVIFNKPNSAISNTLRYFKEDTRFEGEICFLIGNKKIVGVGFGLDLTHAGIQNQMKKKGLPWERAKAFNGSAIFSEFVPFEGKIKELNMKLYINDKLVQFASYDLMIYKPNSMLQEIDSFMSLEDGDVIMSGTPKGVNSYRIDDRFLGQIFSNKELLTEKEWVVK